MFVACTDEKTTTSEVASENLEIKDTLSYKIQVGSDTLYYSIRSIYEMEDGVRDYTQTDLTKTLFTYPFVDSFSTTAIKDSVNKVVQNLLLQDMMGDIRYESIEGRMLEFLKEYKEHKKEMLEFQLPSSNWVFEMKIDVLLNRPSLLSFRVHKLEFTGGAHANSWTNYITIDLRTGKELDLKTLFVGDFEKELLKISETAFKQTLNLAVDTNLTETHYEFSAGEFMLPPNFSVGSQGLFFYYNPYDLGPFALGAISFEIPYKEILSIVDTNILLLEPIMPRVH